MMMIIAPGGGMVEDCQRYDSRLAELIAALSCLRGSKSIRKRRAIVQEQDLGVEKGLTGLN